MNTPYYNHSDNNYNPSINTRIFINLIQFKGLVCARVVAFSYNQRSNGLKIGHVTPRYNLTDG